MGRIEGDGLCPWPVRLGRPACRPGGRGPACIRGIATLSAGLGPRFAPRAARGSYDGRAVGVRRRPALPGGRPGCALGAAGGSDLRASRCYPVPPWDGFVPSADGSGAGTRCSRFWRSRRGRGGCRGRCRTVSSHRPLRLEPTQCPCGSAPTCPGRRSWPSAGGSTGGGSTGLPPRLQPTPEQPWHPRERVDRVHPGLGAVVHGGLPEAGFDGAQSKGRCLRGRGRGGPRRPEPPGRRCGGRESPSAPSPRERGSGSNPWTSPTPGSMGGASSEASESPALPRPRRGRGMHRSEQAPDAGEAEFRRKVREGDPEAWAHLVRRFRGILWRRVKRVLPRAADREAALAEVWYQAFRDAWTYDPDGDPLTWLMVICVRICLQDRRRYRRLVTALARLTTRPTCSRDPVALEPVRGALRSGIACLSRRRDRS